jgi:hypothetical protein
LSRVGTRHSKSSTLFVAELLLLLWLSAVTLPGYGYSAGPHISQASALPAPSMLAAASWPARLVQTA